MTVNEPKNILLCSENEKVVIYAIKGDGTQLERGREFEVDTSLRNPIIVSPP